MISEPKHAMFLVSKSLLVVKISKNRMIPDYLFMQVKLTWLTV